MSVADADQRRQALQVDQSFCVTAPAGSGKTELLIQRLLALLSRVERPEQVLAITFTRKAAAEMRERVMAALADAAAGQPCAEAHQQATRDLALAALARSEQLCWQLSRDQARLNIKTIDSFCASLTRQMPVLSAFGGSAQAVDQADDLYREAVADLLARLGSDSPESVDLAAVLLHFDNNAQRLERLLIAMLARRDQWLPYMGAHRDPDQAERALAATVEQVVTETLAPLAPVFAPFSEQLFDLLCYSLDQRGLPRPEHFPRAQAVGVPGWRLLRELLLTRGERGSWRKRLDVTIGFPPGPGEAQQRKDELKAVIAALAEREGLETALKSLDVLPDMDSHSASWDLVVHLSRLLPVLSALLLLVFQRRGLVDHSQVAQAALQALGEDEAPTDLAQRMDYRIEHILVDEFQDTAINQYRLVERLTRGWGEHNEANPDNPRTLFIVGDAMQSIYGFRDANVGLFLLAQERGFNGVVPARLQLLCNFRSRAGLVDWVNGVFSDAFPARDDIRRGQVSFTPALAVKPAAGQAPVQMHAFCGEGAEGQEAAFIVEQLRPLLSDDSVSSIAILGRSRPQLAPLLAALQAAGIAYAAQDIDRLAGSPVVADLMSLCRALANPADRVAWFSLLRAPWCGLDAAALLVLARLGPVPRYRNPWAILAELPAVEALPAAVRKRLAEFCAALEWAAVKRDRLALRVWIEQVWLRLGGPAAATADRHLRDAERFFDLLQEAEQDGIGLDIQWLETRLDKLYASAANAGAKLQVMTLHKAKGLEFDHVFIPALGKGTRSNSRELLLWEEYNSASGERGFLLAADDHSPSGEPSLYNFIRARGARRALLENTRLLYVGATRAAQQLVLSATLQLDATEDWQPGEPLDFRPPAEGSLLAPVWSQFSAAMQVHEPRPAAAPAVEPAPRVLYRLESLPPVEPVTAVTTAEGPNIPARSLNRLDRHVGTVVHLALEQLSGLDSLPASPGAAQVARWRAELRGLGLEGALLDEAQERVIAAVQSTLDDRQYGHWLLAAGHPEARSELPLTMRDGEGRVKDIVLDRTFIDSDTGVRWIVDYKTSRPAAGQDMDSFLLAEAESYRNQLMSYRDALACVDHREIRCALYFAGLGRLQRLPELDYLPG